MITHEAIAVDVSDPAFVRVRHEQLDDGVDLGGTLVIERITAAALAEQLEAATAQNHYPQWERGFGADAIRVYVSGRDESPCINVINKRPVGALHAGTYGLMMTPKAARELLGALRALSD